MNRCDINIKGVCTGKSGENLLDHIMKAVPMSYWELINLPYSA